MERQAGNSIESIGIYSCYTGIPESQVGFFKACGYNTYQRWDMGWTIGPSKHERYYAEMAEDLHRMMAAGFRTYMLLNINMNQCRDNTTEGYRDAGFDPADAALMRERLAFLAVTIQKFKFVDGFTVFAGDPGGHPHATPAQVIDGTRAVIELISRIAPSTEVNVNTWGIAAWDHFTSPFDVAFWKQEVRLTRQLLEQPDLVGPLASIEFPLHNYYRSLALTCYAQKGEEPELFPSSAEVERLRERGVRRLWGWPYFLTDECDDGYKPGTAGMAQSETQYLKQIIDTGRQLGLNGMVANVFAENIGAEALNLYAFAMFCKDPHATSVEVIEDFAREIAIPESAGDLAQILRFIENHSTWIDGLPPKHRLPMLQIDELRSADDAMEKLARVQVRSAGSRPLPEPQATYISRLRDRLKRLPLTT